jgi:LmbE family N-acetylglucosaminyl deacetylase
LEPIKEKFRYLSEYLLEKQTTEINAVSLKKGSVIFAAHPDDEALGCGGTILKKVKAKAKVNICFLTNGEDSHSDIIPKSELKKIRVDEALNVSRMLGVNDSNLAFLNLPDSGLTERHAKATKQVEEVLLANEPDEIFIPTQFDPIIKDHSAANKIILTAAKSLKKRPVINEYPVWLWYHFPWVNVPSHHPRDFLGYLKRSVFSELDLTLNFHSSVYIGDVLKQKIEILNCYKSQMSHLHSQTNWRSLKDIGHGEFINCFLREYELFYRYQL